jgi:hypothetical protein
MEVENLKNNYSKLKLKKLINEYIGDDSVKSLAGLALFLGVDRATLTQWQTGGDDGFNEIVGYAKTCIEKDIVENGLRGKYNATMASFILKTSFGYRDKGDETPSGPVKIEIADELREFAN